MALSNSEGKGFVPPSPIGREGALAGLPNLRGDQYGVLPSFAENIQVHGSVRVTYSDRRRSLPDKRTFHVIHASSKGEGNLSWAAYSFADYLRGVGKTGVSVLSASIDTHLTQPDTSVIFAAEVSYKEGSEAHTYYFLPTAGTASEMYHKLYKTKVHMEQGGKFSEEFPGDFTRVLHTSETFTPPTIEELLSSN